MVQTVLAALLVTAVSLPVSAQEESGARLGGGSDIPPEVTVQVPQGGSVPPVHVIFADNPADEPIEVEFQAEASGGILIDPEWEEMTIPAGGSVENPFSVEVASGVAPGEYPVVVQLVRSDIESEPGQITSIPAIQAAFTVEVVGDSATVIIRSVSAHSGEPVEATISLSARHGDQGWFEIDRTEGTSLETRVAPGEFRAAVLLGEREVAAEEFTVEADQTFEAEIEVETVSFVVAAVRPVEERGRLVVADLVASVNNETGPIPGPNMLQARVSHDGVEIDTVTLEEVTELPSGITEGTLTYRPEQGWQTGTYRFAFELVTPSFTLAAADQPALEVPETGFDLFVFLAALETREIIVLAAAGLLALIVVERLIRYLIRRHRSRLHPSRNRRQKQDKTRRARKSGRRKKTVPSSQPDESWLEQRIRATTTQTSPSDHDSPNSYPPAPSTTETPNTPASPGPKGSHLATGDLTPSVPEPPASKPSGSTSTNPAGDDSADTAQLVEALRVVQRLHDEESLAPGWSITDATLIYWTMTSPRVHEALGSVGMSDQEYVSAMRRLFTQGLLERGHLPPDTTGD